MNRFLTEKPGKPLASPDTHRNEFPARYSSAGCSPAEPASASLTALILQSSAQPVQGNPVNGRCQNSWLSQKRAHPRKWQNVPRKLAISYRVHGEFLKRGQNQGSVGA